MFWKTAEPNDVRYEDIIIANSFDLCPPLEEKRRRSVRHSSMVSGSTEKLWPYSRISAGIQVLNQAQSGPLSDTIEFETPEGGVFMLTHLSSRLLMCNRASDESICSGTI